MNDYRHECEVTAENIYKNVMSNYANTIDGKKLGNMTVIPHQTLTHQQVDYMKEQIFRQMKGEGINVTDKFWLINEY